MVGWHHQLNEHEFQQTLENVKVQGSLVCCSPWGCKESDTTEQLNKTNGIVHVVITPFIYSIKLKKINQDHTLSS